MSASGQNSWPPPGSFPWPLSVLGEAAVGASRANAFPGARWGAWPLAVGALALLGVFSPKGAGRRDEFRQRLIDDRHVWAAVLFDETVELRFDRSCATFTKGLSSRVWRDGRRRHGDVPARLRRGGCIIARRGRST